MRTDEEHKQRAPAAVRCFIVTVSDTRTEETDTSGRAIAELLTAAGHHVSGRVIVKDEAALVRSTVERQLASGDVDVIISTGGTGIAARDTTFEALEYDIGAGFMFRKALLWHGGVLYRFTRFGKAFRDSESLQWRFECFDARTGVRVEVAVNGGGASLHRLPYVKTNCSGTFEVSNNSLASGRLYLRRDGREEEAIIANGGAVLEMVGG